MRDIKNRKKIIIINGSGGVGKDTFVEMCAKRVPLINYSSVEEIKEIAKKVGWTGSKTERDRAFLSSLKNITTEYSDYSFNNTCEKIEDFLENSEIDLMFIHIREISEIKKIVKEYPFVKTLLIVNENVSSIFSNDSDSGVHDYNYDFNITNHGSLEDLDKIAEAFINLIKAGIESMTLIKFQA